MNKSQDNVISLKGSTQILIEFFSYAINSILFQRAIYPPNDFERVKYYGLTMFVTTEYKLKQYLLKVFKQITYWLNKKEIQQLVLIVTNGDGEVSERWVFSIKYESNSTSQKKDKKTIMKEIGAVIRQIASSVSFLPLLEDECTFDLLIFTNTKVKIPVKWETSPPKFITDGENVKLRSFTTSIHSVSTSVSYKLNDI